jgi:hypothetical protein
MSVKIFMLEIKNILNHLLNNLDNVFQILINILYAKSEKKIQKYNAKGQQTVF